MSAFDIGLRGGHRDRRTDMHPALAATMSQPDLSVDRARNWLLLMAHSSTCRDHASCPIGRHDCDKLKLLRTHVANCNSSSCPVENCDNARAVLRHYRDCHDRHRCAICHSISFLEDGGNEEGGSHETTWYGESANGVLSPPSKYQPYIIHAAPSPYIPLVISTNHFQRHYSPAGYVAEAAAYPNWFIFPPRSVSHNAENVSSPMQNRQSEPITPPPPPSPPPPKRHLVARRPATAFPEKEQWQASDARDGNRVGHTICAETLVSLRPDAPPLKTNLEGDEEESIECDYDMSAAVCQFPFLVKLRDIVANPANASIIAWNERRRVLEIFDKQRLEVEVMPKYFTTHGPKAQFTSFLRQLNNYGFENTLSGRKGQPVYKNIDPTIVSVEDFTRVRKTTVKKKKKRRTSCEDDVAAVDLVLALSKQRPRKPFR